MAELDYVEACNLLAFLQGEEWTKNSTNADKTMLCDQFRADSTPWMIKALKDRMTFLRLLCSSQKDSAWEGRVRKAIENAKSFPHTYEEN